MTWNQTTHINLQRFLDTANGRRFQWEVMADRTSGKRREAYADTCTGISFERTGVVFALYQQVSVLAKWWALAESKQSIGLPARFLFGFGTSKPPGATKTADFICRFAIPVVQRLFRLILRTMGPKRPLGNRTDAGSLHEWRYNVLGERLIRSVRHICHLAGKRPGVGSCLNSGFGKTPYWVANYSLLTSVISQLWCPAAYNQHMDCVRISTMFHFDTLKLSLEFYRLRYLHGLAVLDAEIRNQTWHSKLKAVQQESSLEYHTELCLRTGIGHILRPYHVKNVHEIYQHAEAKKKALREPAVVQVRALFEHMRLLGLGHVLRSTAAEDAFGGIAFQKLSVQAMADETKHWLIKHHIPPWSFECEIERKYEQRSVQSQDPGESTSPKKTSRRANSDMVSKQILAKSSALETSKKAMDFSVSDEATPMESVDVSSCHKVRKQSRKRQVVEMHDAIERNAEDNNSDAIEEEEISIEVVQGPHSYFSASRTQAHGKC